MARKKQRAKKSTSARKLAAIGSVAAVTVTAAAAAVIVRNTSYTVTRVIDGDTFETAEKQRVRLIGIDAPEAGLCGAAESKAKLSSLILHKKVFLKVGYHDSFNRLLANVYMYNGTWVNMEMARTGNALVSQTVNPSAALRKASEEAQAAGKGFYGSSCTQTENPDRSDCNVKGNAAYRSGRKIYHYPGCPLYGLTKVQLYVGDRWFCTEAEAKRSGFVKAAGCP